MNEYEELDRRMKEMENDWKTPASAVGVIVSVILFVIACSVILDTLGLLD